MIRPTISSARALAVFLAVATVLAVPAWSQDVNQELEKKEDGKNRSVDLDFEKFGSGGTGALVMMLFVSIYGVLLIGSGDVMRAVVESAKNTRRQADGPSYWGAITAGVILTIVGSLVLAAGFLATVIPCVARLGKG